MSRARERERERGRVQRKLINEIRCCGVYQRRGIVRCRFWSFTFRSMVLILSIILLLYSFLKILLNKFSLWIKLWQRRSPDQRVNLLGEMRVGNPFSFSLNLHKWDWSENKNAWVKTSSGLKILETKAISYFMYVEFFF